MSRYVPHAGEQLHQATIAKGNTHHKIWRRNAPRSQVDQTQHECRQGEGAQTQRRRVGKLSPLDGLVCTGLELTTESREARLFGVDVCERAIAKASGGFGSLMLLVGHLAGDVVMIVVTVGSVVAGAGGGVVFFVVIIVKMAGIVLLGGSYSGHFCRMKGRRDERSYGETSGDEVVYIENITGKIILLSSKDEWRRRKDNDDSRPLDVLDSGRGGSITCRKGQRQMLTLYTRADRMGSPSGDAEKRPLPPVG